MDTNAEIHFLPVDDSQTHALSKDTKHLRLDGRVNAVPSVSDPYWHNSQDRPGMPLESV